MLSQTVGDLLASTKIEGRLYPCGVIAPHAGYAYSGPVAAHAFACLRQLHGRIERAVIIGPAHYVPFVGISAPADRAFATPLGDVPVDVATVEALNEEGLEKGRQKIIDIYQAKGFTNVDVKFHVDTDEAHGTSRVVYTINEGTKGTISAVRFEGNTKFSDRTLRKQIKTKGKTFYSFIDKETKGSISGMIAGTAKMLAMIDSNTKVVPGHGPLGNKTDLRNFHDMLVTARTRVQKLKSAGKSLDEAVAAKPLADLDPVWGKGTLNGDAFVHVVYTTL